MDWIKKNTAQFVLALVAVLLLALSVLVFLKTQSFGEGFSAAKVTPNRKADIKPVDTGVIDAAQKELSSPTQWAPTPEAGSLFVSWKMIKGPDGRLVRAEKGSVGGRIPNEWLLKHELDILSTSVLNEDPDKDGFSNLDEYLGNDLSEANGDKDSTDPRNKDSHPSYHTKLFLKQYIKVPFRLLFNAYDGDPKRDKPEAMNFQINTVDLRQPSVFLKIGEMVPNTKFKLTKFEPKYKKNESIGEEEEVSELTVEHTETKETIILVYTKITDSPDSFALFSYLWPDVKQPQDIRVKKLQEFVLKPNITEKYKLIDIKETEAVIQLPNGEKYTVPPLPKK